MVKLQMLSIQEIINILQEIENQTACEYVDIRLNTKKNVLEISPSYLPPRDEEKTIKNIIA